MATYSDLSPHEYVEEWRGTGAVNVGWLGVELEFPRGTVPSEVRALLDRICARPEVRHCGYHPCPFCPQVPVRVGTRLRDHAAKLHRDSEVLVGSGVVRITGEDGTVYVAPDMIAHYVNEHGYAPPPSFLAAVRHSDASRR